MDQQHTEQQQAQQQSQQVPGARAIKVLFEVGAGQSFVAIKVAIEDNALGVTRADCGSLIRIDKLNREPLEMEWRRLVDQAIAIVHARMMAGNPLYLVLPALLNGGPEIMTGRPTNDPPTPPDVPDNGNDEDAQREEEEVTS